MVYPGTATHLSTQPLKAECTHKHNAGGLNPLRVSAFYANEIKGGIAHLFAGDKAGQVARRILDDAEKKVSQYFGTLVVVNFCLAAIAMGLASAVGLPNPLLWGVLAGTLSFIPYLGPAIIVAALFVIGLLSFPKFSQTHSSRLSSGSS